jgi:hypothetical protein
MSFYSNNLGKNTIGGGTLSGFNFNKGNKENLSPYKVEPTLQGFNK